MSVCIKRRFRSGIIVCILFTACCISAGARERIGEPSVGSSDTIMKERQTVETLSPVLLTHADSMSISMKDSRKVRKPHDWTTWKPDPKRALWLALVLPGAGQIYNRKYWKLPIVYGGFVGCAYAIRWNNQMYHDYSQAYIDIMDDDPTTQSYNKFLHLGATITPSNMAQYQTVFKKRKDRYRRYRDLSIFTLIGVYALSVIDAYVDASLSEFDISEDLSLRVEPTVINATDGRSLMRSNGIGIHCSLTF